MVFTIMLLFQAANAKLEDEVKDLWDHSNKFKHEIKRVADAFSGVERERDRFRADLAAERR